MNHPSSQLWNRSLPLSASLSSKTPHSRDQPTTNDCFFWCLLLSKWLVRVGSCERFCVGWLKVIIVLVWILGLRSISSSVSASAEVRARSDAAATHQFTVSSLFSSKLSICELFGTVLDEEAWLTSCRPRNHTARPLDIS